MERWPARPALRSDRRALLTGWLAARRLGHDSVGHDLVHVHRNLMVAATVLGVIASAVAWKVEPQRGRPGAFALLGLLLLLSAVLTLGADRGARLVYGHGVGLAEGVVLTPAAPPAGGHGAGGHDHGGHSH